MIPRRREVDKQPRGRAFGFILKPAWTQPSSLAYTHIHFLHRPLSPALQLIPPRTAEDVARDVQETPMNMRVEKANVCNGWRFDCLEKKKDRGRDSRERGKQQRREPSLLSYLSVCSATLFSSQISSASQLVLIKICKWRRTADLKSAPPGDLDQCAHGCGKLPGFSLGQWREYSCFLKRSGWDGFTGFIHL